MTTHLLEWVGQPAIFEDPFVVNRLQTGGYTKDQARKIRSAARRRTRRIDGQSVRRLPPESTGPLTVLTRTLEWGPRQYVIEVTKAELDAVLACSSGNEFRDVTHGKPTGPALLLPRHDIRLVREEEVGDEYRRSSGR